MMVTATATAIYDGWWVVHYNGWCPSYLYNARSRTARTQATWSSPYCCWALALLVDMRLITPKLLLVLVQRVYRRMIWSPLSCFWPLSMGSEGAVMCPTSAYLGCSENRGTQYYCIFSSTCLRRRRAAVTVQHIVHGRCTGLNSFVISRSYWNTICRRSNVVMWLRKRHTPLFLTAVTFFCTFRIFFAFFPHFFSSASLYYSLSYKRTHLWES